MQNDSGAYDNNEIVEKVYKIYNGRYRKSEIRDLLQMFTKVAVDIFITTGRLRITKFGNLYINFEGKRALWDLVKNKRVVKNVYVPRFKPSIPMKKRMKENYNYNENQLIPSYGDDDND